MGSGGARAPTDCDASLTKRLAKGRCVPLGLSPLGARAALPLAFPFPAISNHALGAFGFKALEQELADGLEPLPFSFLPPASDLPAEKMFHLLVRSVGPALAKSKAACLYVCEQGI